MLPLRVLGLLMLTILLRDAESTCTTDSNPLTLDPPEIVGAYGETVTVNCSTDELYHEGMYWRDGIKINDEETSVLLHLTLSDWNVKQECRIMINDSLECGKDLKITIYKTPDIVSVSAKHHGLMVEGIEFQLNCDIINVAPVQKLKVKWYRGNETVHTETFNGTSATPVNVTSSFVVTPERDYNGTLFRCEAELHLGPNGPELIPTKSSSPYTAVVNYKPLNQACPKRYTGVEDHFSMSVLDCDADGNPSPTLQWYYQGNLIDASELLNRTHSGMYTAKFVNSIGTSETSVNITIEYAPLFTCNDHYEVQEDDKPQTVCEPKGMPKPTITWFKDGKEIETPQRWTKHDSGQYLLRAINEHGTANHSLHLDVLYAPEFKNNTHFNVSVVEGNDFTLTCEADGSPPPVFNWTHDGVNILEYANDLNLTRVMSNATYSCIATNKLGSITKQIHVHVIKNTTRAIQETMTTPEESAQTDCPLTLTPSEVAVRFGDQVSINCSTSATDALGMGWEAAVGGKGFKNVTAVTWTVEQIEEWTIKPDCYITLNNWQCTVTPNITLYKTPDIVSVSAKHHGLMVEGTEFQLNCDIINVAPVQKLKVKWYRGNETVHTETFNGTSATPVNVTSSFVVTPERDYNGALFRCEAELHLGPNGPELIPTKSSSPYTAVVNYKPLIQACPKRYTGVEDHFSMSVLDCDADGNPSPTLQWYYQGNLINASKPLNRTHSGMYTAKFVNSIGISETSVNITIEYAPLFTCNDHYEVQEADKPQTVCEPKGMPKPTITWFKDGKEIETPQRWTKHDSGQYLLRAINEHGTANHSLHLDVLYAPEFKNNTHFNVSVVEGNDFTLTCEADGSPPPVFNWTHDGVNILEYANYLNLTRVMSNATYSCIATNKLGSITKQIHVHVIKNTTRAIQETMTTPEESAQTDCPLTLTPSEVAVRFGDQVSINCSTSATDALGMGWEAAVGGKGFKNVTAVTWTVERIVEWTIKPDCYITLNNWQCTVTPNITLYKTPDIVSVSAKHHGLMVEGTEFQLNCDIINVAPVQKLKVKWYRGNETVHTETFNGTSATPVNVTSSFVVTPERDYNGTLFRCEAELHLGPNGPELIPTKSSSPYTAVVNYKPLIQACPKRYTGVEDHFRMSMLDCDADGNPSPTLQWYYQGNLINASELLNRTHSGKYTAKFVNSIGISETSIDITIEYAPLFTCNDHYEVQEDDKPQTVCEPKGMPKPTITWFKDGKGIETPQRWTKHDSGQYLLRAINKHGTANHSLHLDVLYAPVFKQENNTMTITPGENVTFDCHAVGNPPPVIRWNYTSAENVMETTWGRQRNITVKGATSTNAAVYICVATNKVGSVTRSVKLIMQGENASAQINPKIWWFIIPLTIVLLITTIIIIYHKCQNKHGRYNFVPLPGSDIPLTTKS